MPGKRPLTERGVRKLSEREREVGLDSEDEAARWLAEHEPTAETPQPAASRKSKELHRWRQRQSRAGPLDRPTESQALRDGSFVSS